MSVLDALDATRLCSRWSPTDPAVWVSSAPVVLRRTPPVVLHRTPPPVRRQGTSWTALARNPRAMVLSGMVGAVVVKDSMLRLVAPRL